MYQVYRITNEINHMVYIGSTNNINERWRQHQSCAFNPNDHHYNYPLMRAFREYGIENFKFEVVETVNDWQTMINKEQQWILKENCIIPNGYNQTNRTDSPMFDPEVAKRMSETKREIYGKKVCEIDKQGNILQVWDSLAEASEQTQLNRFKISSVCSGNRLTTGNRIFRFLDTENNLIIPHKAVNQTQSNRITKNSQAVIKIDLTTNEQLEVYDSVALAGLKNNCDASGISKVCRGKRNSCGGFKWQYKIN